MEAKDFKVVYKPKAHNQIYQIMMYIEDKGYTETAEKFANRLYAFGDSLVVFPEKYAICRFQKLAERNLRCAVFNRTYIFVYKMVRKQLVIYNVIHCKRLK